jgi:glycosyltransferase involved in cell wall biosynthesis
LNAVPRRVLIIGPTPPPFHGVATFIRDLVRASDRFPHFKFDALDTSDRRDASNLGRWEAGNLALGFANLAEMASRLGRQRHDLVYVPISQNIPAFLRDALFILQARLFGARVVLHLHGGHFREFYDRESPGWFRPIARWTLNRAAAVAVLSSEFRPIFEGLIPSDRICVVENGVPDLFSNMIVDESQDAAPHTILYMSTLARTKGILGLIRAMPALRKCISDARLRIAGNWSEVDTHDEALTFIAQNGLHDCIEFVGNVDGLVKRDFLKSGSVFCLPSRYPYEGQPLSILEAMSAGLPVLSTRQGAIGSMVIDGETGRLLHPGCSPDDIATVLISMFSDRKTLHAQGIAGRKRYCRNYTLERCHQRLVEVFEDALFPSPVGERADAGTPARGEGKRAD